jgi:hypothetical protein
VTPICRRQHISILLERSTTTTSKRACDTINAMFTSDFLHGLAIRRYDCISMASRKDHWGFQRANGFIPVSIDLLMLTGENDIEEQSRP